MLLAFGQWHMELLIVLSEHTALAPQRLSVSTICSCSQVRTAFEHHPCHHLFKEVHLVLGHLAQHLVELSGVLAEGLVLSPFEFEAKGAKIVGHVHLVVDCPLLIPTVLLILKLCRWHGMRTLL